MEKLFGPENNVKLAMDKLIMAGHSFGGMTAISVSRLDPRVKLCATLDPWLFVYSKEILNTDFKVSIPQVVVNSEMFHTDAKYMKEGFKTWDSLQK